jgi:LAS superfamily LD-carboxypeptidase LdcB
MNTRTVPIRRRRRILVGATALLGAVILAFAVQQSLSAASASVANETPTVDTAAPPAPPQNDVAGSVIAPSEADGVIRDGDQPTVFDTGRVSIDNLDPALLEALQRAAQDAAADGLEFRVNSGWRSAALQERMLQDAVIHYGSEAEAARWVATPETSAHVSGKAVDLGPLRTLDWLAQHGSDYGLCQTYANEPWHWELRADAATDGCPEMYTDPTDDPRMQP